MRTNRECFKVALAAIYLWRDHAAFLGRQRDTKGRLAAAEKRVSKYEVNQVRNVGLSESIAARSCGVPPRLYDIRAFLMADANDRGAAVAGGEQVRSVIASEPPSSEGGEEKT